jgi:hypothetical protein
MARAVRGFHEGAGVGRSESSWAIEMVTPATARNPCEPSLLALPQALHTRAIALSEAARSTYPSPFSTYSPAPTVLSAYPRGCADLKPDHYPALVDLPDGRHVLVDTGDNPFSAVPDARQQRAMDRIDLQAAASLPAVRMVGE